MKVHAFICTRSKDLKSVTTKLVEYLKAAGVEVSLIVNSSSIFKGYKKALDRAKPNPDDIIILCHDDIEILNHKDSFIKVLVTNLLHQPKTGFLGVAGTTYLSEDAVWWNHQLWQKGKHSGFVLHGEDINNLQPTYYGEYREVVVLDGLFLAASAKTLQTVGLEKPEYFEGEWDFYDIHYTTKAREMGLKNKTVPLFIVHNSGGDLVGRDSWAKNREAFTQNHSLPFEV